MIRTYIGCWLIRLGVAIVPKEVIHLVRGMLMYHVPGALSEEEKAEIRAAKAAANG